MMGSTHGSTDAPLADRNPYKAVNEAADHLNRHNRAFDARANHDSGMALNAAGTGETMETNHSVVARVPTDLARDFERAAREVVGLGVEITRRGDGTGHTQRFVLRPVSPDDGSGQESTGIEEL